MTHGGKRTGAGRRHLNGSPPGEGKKAGRYSVTLPEGVAEYLRRIGHGNLSAGVRVAAKEARKTMFKIMIKHENDNGSEFGYGVYVNAYIKFNDEDKLHENDIGVIYASECVPFGQNTSDNLKAAEKRVREQARYQAKKEWMGDY